MHKYVMYYLWDYWTIGDHSSHRPCIRSKYSKYLDHTRELGAQDKRARLHTSLQNQML